MDYILSIRCSACGNTIRKKTDHEPTENDRIAAACSAGWGLAMHDDTLLLICTNLPCGAYALTRKGTIRKRAMRSLRTETIGRQPK